jgi:NDP-sugar pyrophosphorylase family protein
MTKTAMILGAGRGTRLAPLGLDVPKVLVDLEGSPLLERQIAYLAREGVGHVVINAHHRAEAIVSFAREHTGAPELSIVTEPTLLGTAGGVRNALELLGDEPFFVLYGDVVVDEPLAPIEAEHRRRGAAATVTVYESDDVKGKGTVLTDSDGWVTAFAEKAATATPGPALVNAGIYLLDPAFVADLPSGVELDFGHDVFPKAVARGERVLAYSLSGPVIDVGTPDGLERARNTLRGGGSSTRSDSAGA